MLKLPTRFGPVLFHQVCSGIIWRYSHAKIYPIRHNQRLQAMVELYIDIISEKKKLIYIYTFVYIDNTLKLKTYNTLCCQVMFFDPRSRRSVQPLVLHEFSGLAHDQTEQKHGEGEANGRGVQDFASGRIEGKG